MNEANTASASQAGAKNVPSHAGAKVTVCSKYPSPLRLTVCEMRPFTEPVMGGGVRETKIAQRVGVIHLNGNSKKVEEAFGCPVIGGYAVTPNVDKALWDKWLADNKDSDLVRNRIVFAEGDQGRAEDRAREQAKVRSNLEPLDRDPSADPRAPKGGPFKVEEGKRAA